MPKPEKIATVEEIREKLDSAKIAILTEFQGLNVAEMTELRKLFREANVDYKVYRNTLTRIAAQELGVSGIDDHLIGTTALVSCKDDLIAPAKIVKDFGAKHQNFRVKAGILDKKVIGSDYVIELASIPPREVLIAQLLGGMQAPISGLLSVLQGTIRSFVSLLRNLAEQKGEGEDESESESEAKAESTPASES